MSSLSKTPDDVPIVKRRPIFKQNTEEQCWIPKGPGLETYYDTWSCYLPQGERFFIRSVAYYRNQITDPKLLDDIERFIAQEAMHGLHHSEINQVLHKRNHYSEDIERSHQLTVKLFQGRLLSKFQLAYTVCAEHFTASYFKMFAANIDWLMTHASRPNRTIWLWHTLEETEHKAVAFDVLMATTKHKWVAYLVRTSTMIVVGPLTAIGIHFAMIFMALGRRKKLNVKKIKPKKYWWQTRIDELDESVAQSALRVTLFSFKHTFWHFADFFKYSFHPWDHDTRKDLKKLIAVYDKEMAEMAEENTTNEYA